MKYHVFVDTESTDLLRNNLASVCEVGAVCFNSEGFEVSSFSTLVKPLGQEDEWSQEAMKIHNIPPSELHIAPTPALAWDRLFSWMTLHTPVVHVYAYNVSFDQPMLVRTMPQADHLPWGPCLMIAAAKHIGGAHRKRISLKKSCAHWNIGMGSAHKAVDDARSAGLVWLNLRREESKYL